MKRGVKNTLAIIKIAANIISLIIYNFVSFIPLILIIVLNIKEGFDSSANKCKTKNYDYYYDYYYLSIRSHCEVLS